MDWRGLEPLTSCVRGRHSTTELPALPILARKSPFKRERLRCVLGQLLALGFLESLVPHTSHTDLLASRYSFPHPLQ